MRRSLHWTYCNRIWYIGRRPWHKQIEKTKKGVLNFEGSKFGLFFDLAWASTQCRAACDNYSYRNAMEGQQHW